MAQLSPKTPAGRIKRSAIQAVVGFVPAVVTIVNQDHLSAVHAAKYGGTSVTAVLVIAVVQNFAEKKGWIGTAQP